MANDITKKLSTDPYKGVRDFYPEDMFFQNHIFSIMRKTVESFGYEEYGASVLEPTDLYRAKSGEEIVNEQTYNFKDRGERDVTLRPEMTPTVARMVAGKKRELAFPLRWYSIPNLFRYEQPQKGRLREHWQLNVDLFGADGIEADVEIISLAYNIMKNLGAKDENFQIRINGKLLTEVLNANFFELKPSESFALRKLVDKRKKITESDFIDGVNKIFINNHKADLFIKSLEYKGGTYLKWISENAMGPESNPLIHQSYSEISKILSNLNSLGINNVIFDPEIQRGFDYYTGMVFEVYDTNPANRRALFGGGRYDNLTEIFGGEKVPAVGFGMGDVTARDFLETHELLPKYKSETDLYICKTSNDMSEHSQTLAQELREQGLNVAVDVSDKKIGDQIKTASKKAIPFITCVGENEIKTSRYKIKNLESGEETELEKKELAEYIKNKK